MTGQHICEKCGETSPADAAFCGTCGSRHAAPHIIGELVDDTAQAAPRPDGPPARTTEHVDAPAYGETGSVVPPVVPPVVAPVVEPEPVAFAPDATAVIPSYQPPQPAPYITPVVVATGSTRSASLMIAALAVLVVGIAGGSFALLMSGGNTASQPIDDPVASSVGPATPTTLVPATEAESSDPAVAEQPEVATTPTPVTTLAPVTTPAPVTTLEATTVPAAPEPTSPPVAVVPAPGRGAGDLGLTQPILDEVCDGRFITFVGSAVGQQPYTNVVSTLLNQYPGTNYIWTKSCPSLRQEFTDGADIYGVVFGPYATVQEACNAIDFGPADAYVRRISTFDPQDHTVSC
jgi:hypothetical protein